MFPVQICMAQADAGIVCLSCLSEQFSGSSQLIARMKLNHIQLPGHLEECIALASD